MDRKFICARDQSVAIRIDHDLLVKFRIVFGRVPGMLGPMQRAWLWLVLASLMVWSEAASAASGKVIKVLPHFLDLKGKNTLNPSLYERDAYQAYLRRTPAERSALRFDAQWHAFRTTHLKLRLEIRGMKEKTPTHLILETEIKKNGWFEKWTALKLEGEAYKNFGELSAWRATLWDGDKLLNEQKSFLW